VSVVLLVSLIVRSVAAVWATVLARRDRDVRMGFVALMLALMSARQTFTLVANTTARRPGAGLSFGPASEIPGLLVSVLALFAVLALARFLEEHRASLAALAESDRLLRTFADHSPDFLSLHDADGTIRWINRVDPNLTEADVLGRNAADFVAAEERDRLRGMFREAAESGAPRSFEVVVEPGASSRRMAVNVAPILSDGKVTGLVAISSDVTERRHMERLLDRSRRLDALGTLSGGVAHDFNNLLTAILGSAELARRNVERLPDSREARRIDGALGRILAASERASGLTRQLLAFGRRQTGRVVVLDPNAAIRALEDLARGMIGEAVRLEFRPGRDVANVRIDPAQFEQIVLNLLINARDAVREHGRIQVDTTVVDVDAAYVERNPEATPGRKVVMRVSDDGVGMDERTLAHVFDPFFTTKPAGTGSGLGLATVYGLVRQAGGHVEVDSRPAQGSTFRVFLPAVDRPADVEVAPVEIRDGTGEVVLLCDDDPLVREVARETLIAHGYVVVAAGGGAGAVHAARSFEGPIDVLLTDVVMPEMNGRELAERIVETRPDTRVLFMSGHDPDEARMNDVRVPVHGFLEKPFSTAELLRGIREILDRP